MFSKRSIGIGLAGMAFGALLASPSGFASAKDLTIGVAMPTQQEERWRNDARYFQEEAQKLGVTIKLQVADNDSNKQITQIENFVTEGVDALIIAAVDPGAVGPAAQQAVNKKIPVVSYARSVANADVGAMVAFHYLQVGKLSSDYAYSLAPKGNYVILNGDKTTLPDVPLYRQGHYAGIQKAIDSGDIHVVMDQYMEQWKPENGLAAAENALTQNKNIAAFLCANDGIAGGVIQALKSAGLDGKVVVTGNDGDITALRRIAAGTQSSTIFQNTREEAKAALETAIKLVKGEKIDATATMPNGKIDVPLVQLEPQLVTKANLDKVIIEPGFHSHKDVYGN